MWSWNSVVNLSEPGTVCFGRLLITDFISLIDRDRSECRSQGQVGLAQKRPHPSLTVTRSFSGLWWPDLTHDLTSRLAPVGLHNHCHWSPYQTWDLTHFQVLSGNPRSACPEAMCDPSGTSQRNAFVGAVSSTYQTIKAHLKIIKPDLTLLLLSVS